MIKKLMILKKFFSITILIIAMLNIFLLTGCTNTTSKQKTIIKTTDVALLSLFTFDGKKESTLGLMNLGHSFLSIENISSDVIKIANVTLAPNETIAIGTWSISAHFGIWYNVESNYIAEHNKYDGRLSITTGISLDDMVSITNYILSHDYWTPLANCSCFALNLWNEVAENSEKLSKPLIYSPSHLAKCMKNFENYEENKEIITDTNFHYFEGTNPVYYYMDGEYVGI